MVIARHYAMFSHDTSLRHGYVIRPIGRLAIDWRMSHPRPDSRSITAGVV